MARVQYGTIVTEIKGKNQGHVFQGGNVGFVLRSKGYTKGISSGARSSANVGLSANSSMWRTLLDVERTLWGNVAPNWLFTNKFGQQYQGNGFQIFTAWNGNLRRLGFGPISAPTPVTSPADPGNLTVSYSLGSGLIASWDNPGGANDFIIPFAAAPASAGRNTNHARYLALDSFSYNGITSGDLTSDYVGKYGTPAIGQRVTIKCSFAIRSFPYYSFTQIATCLVTA